MNLDFRRIAGLWDGIVMVGQLGLSLLMPLLLCLAGTYLLVSRVGLGAWVYLPGFVLGLGGSFSTAWGVYRSVMHRQAGRGDKKVRRAEEFSVSRHV